MTEEPARTPTWVLLLCAVAGGGLLWASFFPLNLGFLGWVGLVPVALLTRAQAGKWRLFLASWLAGLLFFFPATQWIRVAHPMMVFAWVGLATYCSLHVPVAVFLTRRLLRTRIPLTVAFPAVWVALEYSRGMLLGGFPWYFVAHSQHDYPALIQVSDLGGAYGLSFVMAGVSALAASVLARLGSFRLERGPVPVLTGLLVLGLVGGTVAYGYHRLEHPAFGEGPHVALIQGNISQEVRNSRTKTGSRDTSAVAKMEKEHFGLTAEAVAQDPKPDVVIWPETSYPRPWIILPEERPTAMPEDGWRAASEAGAKAAADFTRIAGHYGTPVLLGLNSGRLTPDGRRVRYNTALLVSPDGGEFPAYHKMHRVPFGEFVPFGETLPFMKNFTPYEHDYGIEAGTEYTRFPVQSDDDTYHFGVLICYEDSDPTLARRYVAGNTGEDVDFLVNISNDGWFKGTEEHEQHLAICRFRAVEARRSVARAVNMGISAVIDPDGRVVALPAETWGDSKKRTAVVSAVVPLDRRESVYAQFGDWVPATCGLIVVGGFLVGFRRRRDVA